MMSSKLFAGVCGAIVSIKIINGSEILERISSIFSSSSSVTESVEMIQKLSSSSLQCPLIESFTEDIASSIQAEVSSGSYLRSFGIAALGAALISSGFGVRHCLTRKNRPDSKHRKSTSGGSQPTRYRGFLNRFANHCFANALLACLVYLPGFKEKICHAAAAPKNSSNLVLKSLAALFIAINQNRRRWDIPAVGTQKEKFCDEITQSSPEIQVFHEKGGDSRSLFQILCQSLPSNLQCFSFKQEKTITCEDCLSQGRQIIPKRFVENPFMLDIQEDSYFQTNHYFPPQTELRTCKACGPSSPDRPGRIHRKQVTLSDFPEVLAIRIGDTPGFQREQVGPWLEIFLGKTEGEKQGYRFAGAVYNTMKGYDGSHSVAYVYKQGKNRDRPFLCYNDIDVRRVSFEDIGGYPKLMFYVKDSSESAVLDVGEEKVSEESTDENSEERNEFVDFEWV